MGHDEFSYLENSVKRDVAYEDIGGLSAESNIAPRVHMMCFPNSAKRNPRKVHNYGKGFDHLLPISKTAREHRLSLNHHFIRTDDIHHEILQKRICTFLGPEAYFKPSAYKVVATFSTCWTDT